MSQLTLTARQTNQQFKLNVTQFRSPMSSQIDTSQTRTMLQHFPIRCGQPDIQFTVQFPSLDEKHKFQNFVREHQVQALNVTQDKRQDVILFWPERNIENWAGYITTFKVVERRFDYAPTVTFGVDLVDSMMSQYTNIASTSTGIGAILGQQLPALADVVDSILALPAAIISQVISPTRSGG